MRALFKLFGRSPFAPLARHMERVEACVAELKGLFSTLAQGEAVDEISKKISKLEHEADLAKNDIRKGMKTSLFLPVDRMGLLEVLSLQDALADQAEDIGILLTLRKPEKPPVNFSSFLEKNLEAFAGVSAIMHELPELVESSFGGPEAEKLRQMVDHVAYLEHKVDLEQREILKVLYNSEETLSYAAFHMWNQVVFEVSQISNLSEKLANRLLMTMEVK